MGCQPSLAVSINWLAAQIAYIIIFRIEINTSPCDFPICEKLTASIFYNSKASQVGVSPPNTVVDDGDNLVGEPAAIGWPIGNLVNIIDRKSRYVPG